ncbi:cation transport ATPase [Candidatus Scalindua japonica]|uniref:Cation transport ATPase n=1 Tax=Candidatus Scalindua japonica TaxID=1284222 RepID=A0A286TT98_9BACT|nr:YHS domain-containing protein [Candidatus Scalindua japonica]GAX59091.1 cation transport ATPase [Candidatus Scalindua japonica]
MNCITRKILILTFLVCLSSIYLNSNLWASGCCGGGNSGKKSGMHSDQKMADVKSERADVIKDPVCGMEVNGLKKSPSAVHKGKDYNFCSEYCKKTFKNDPASYTSETEHQYSDG